MMNLIDCHAHCVPPTILEALREFAAGSYLGKSLYADDGFASLEKHLKLMDRFGVDKEVINYGNLLVPAARAAKAVGTGSDQRRFLISRIKMA